MVKYLISSLLTCVLSLCLVSGCGAEERYDEEDESTPILYPSELAEVVSVVVTLPSDDINAGPDGDERLIGYPDCRPFFMTPQIVERYLSAAHKIDERDYMHTIIWAPCRASGTVLFADGKEAEWRIMQSGGGRLDFSDGSAEYLYCDKCPPPFVN